MNLKIVLIAASFFFASGCGFFSKKVESIVEKAELKNQTATLRPAKKNLFCSDESKTQFIVEDELTLKFYTPVFKALLENKELGFVQRSVMYSMMELLRRPDQVTPQSRLQIFLRYKGKDTYLDISPKNSSDFSVMSYLKGLELLLKSSEGQADLLKLADTVDAQLPPAMNVSPGFEQFLQTHREEISKNEELAEVFFKGDEILTKHESFKRPSMKKIVQLYKNSKKVSDTFFSINDSPLSAYPSESRELTVLCNFNINQETVSKEELLDAKAKKSGHYFAFMEGNNLFIATVSSTIPQKLGNIKGTYFFNVNASNSPRPFCEFKTKNQDTLLFSSKGRFPGQHLRHLITYDIGQVDSQSSLQELLTFSRHLFLSNPDRILYESKRGRKSQLDFFLSMNFPIYHVSSLGDLVGASIFSTPLQTSRSLVIDDRSTARLRCSY